jgi:hypothetical protein
MPMNLQPQIRVHSLILLLCVVVINAATSQNLRIGLLKYSGGGDWYANPTSLPNLIAFCNKNLSTNIHREADVVEVGSPDIFNYPFLHMTGHGNVIFSAADASNLRRYLLSGGFLHIDDNYGMDRFIRPELRKVFPELELTELPSNHPIFHQKYKFPAGIPKIHEHDDKPPQAFGLFDKGRLILLYTFETDLGDGWEDADVHRDSEEKRLQALQMGANIIQYVFSGGI